MKYHSKFQNHYYNHQMHGWNKTAEECYLRGCVCEGCQIKKTYFQGKKQCRMKGAVIELVLRFGVPEYIKRNDILED